MKPKHTFWIAEIAKSIRNDSYFEHYGKAFSSACGQTNPFIGFFRSNGIRKLSRFSNNFL